jgi:hypothetical protein
MLQTQEPFDFRELMVVDDNREGRWCGNGNFRFNDGHYLSIISGERTCSDPNSFVPLSHYEGWEVHTSQPEYRERYLDEDEVEEIALFRQSPNYDIRDDFGSLELVRLDPDFQMGGVLYDFPHKHLFVSYDQVICPSTKQLQDMVDFLRARFGWREDPKMRHYC